MNPLIILYYELLNCTELQGIIKEKMKVGYFGLNKIRCIKTSVLVFAASLLLLAAPSFAWAEDAVPSPSPEPTPDYDIDAALFKPETGDYPGVYVADANPAGVPDSTDPDNPEVVTVSTDPDNPTTIGIPSIADENLPDAPTTESPAIIQGAAVSYEEKVGPTEYKTIKEGKPEVYEEFPVVILEEQAQDGTVHKKLSGFDGTYVILRLDVSDYFTEETDVLHVKQTANYAVIPLNGMLTAEKVKEENRFADGYGNFTASYTKADLVDKNDTTNTPYVDVLLFSSGKLAAGADAGKEGAPDGDVPVQMYVDKTVDYDPDLTYDPLSTDPEHANKVLAKFFDAAKTAANKISNYLVKGKDLALETAVEESNGSDTGSVTTYWSLEKAIEKPYYDKETGGECGQTVKMICEVPVTDELNLEGTGDTPKKRTLNLNSFDIQIANNTAEQKDTPTTGFNLKNGWLKIEDLSNTTGAELAIGNNARFLIDRGGKLIIDTSCQLEIEWDGATTTLTDGQTQPQQDVLNNGILDLRAGGEIENNGVITIEGPEGKPIEPVQGQQGTEAEKGYGELTVQEGAVLTNNGCLIVYGKLYNYGTLVNNGKYDDTIDSIDPDKGIYSYHKGIQVSWKDDVTQSGVWPGVLINGQNREGTIFADAVMSNSGDIVLVPGSLENYGQLINNEGGRILLATATDAIIPIVPDPNNPTIVTKRIKLNPVKSSYIDNYGTIDNYGAISPVTVRLNDDGSFGTMTIPGNHPELFTINNYGVINNKGYIYVFEGYPSKPLAGVLFGENMWLYLYKDGTFLMILPNGEVLTGTYRIDGNVLVFTFDDGSEIIPAEDENGDSLYSFTSPAGYEFEFVISKEFPDSLSLI